jgi:hypothetical protein
VGGAFRGAGVDESNNRHGGKDYYIDTGLSGSWIIPRGHAMPKRFSDTPSIIALAMTQEEVNCKTPASVVTTDAEEALAYARGRS